MFLVGILSWWYIDGWIGRFRLLAGWLKSSIDFFSINTIIPNLFAPFRQISAGGSTSDYIGSQIQAFFDKLLSRFIGAFMRIIMLIAGLIFMTFQIVIGLVVIIFWLIIPFFPVIGIIFATIGVKLI